MSLLWIIVIGIIKLPNAAIHDNDNWTCNNFEIGRKKTGVNKRLKCRCLRQQQLKKFKNQMALYKIATIKSN